jgi:hypothetical protein
VLVASGRDWAWSEDLVASLAELRHHYANWNPEMLAKQLTPLGCETQQLNRTGPDGVRQNRRGVDLASIVAAIEARKVVPIRALPVAPDPATGSTGM